MHLPRLRRKEPVAPLPRMWLAQQPNSFDRAIRFAYHGR